MLRRRRTLICAVALLLLAGCQTDTPTASGSPEITVQGARPDQVKPLLLNAALNKGLRLTADTPYQLTFEQPWGGSKAGGVIVGALIASNAREVRERVTFSIAESGGGTRIVANRYMIRAGAFGREEIDPADRGLGTENLQTMLDAMSPALQPAPAMAKR